MGMEKFKEGRKEGKGREQKGREGKEAKKEYVLEKRTPSLSCHADFFMAHWFLKQFASHTKLTASKGSNRDWL